MKKQAFSSEKYLNLQRDHILERINQFDGKLYLEFGGKMLEDFHAARVLPGYEPDNKIKLLQEINPKVFIASACLHLFLLAKAIQVRLHLFIVLLFCEIFSLQPIGINRVLERDFTGFIIQYIILDKGSL